MGICLDTEQQNGSQVFEEGDARNAGKWRGEAGLLATPPGGQFPMQNIGPVKFQSPNVPVIFVLGGPGSGKVTHCDNLVQEKKGITHINMTDLLQQYALGNDMQDFGQLSSKTVTEVLMLEMKMSPGAKTYLVSGYPRNMRDVVEYAEKIQIVNGVILVSWRQEALERQIDYGAQLGHVILGLARMELQNFYRNVMPVVEYFDQSGLMVEVNGERNPSEVYVDFREAVLRILGVTEGDIPLRQDPRSLEAEVEVERTREAEIASPVMERDETTEEEEPSETRPSPAPPKDEIIDANSDVKPRKGLPAFIWVIGGPGSNKSALCTQAVRNMPGWVHVSIGGVLRAMATSNTQVSDAIVSGEMVPQDIVMQAVEQQILANRDNDGIVIDSFPRDLHQVQEFEGKFGQEPPLVLLDCSKLQLGRGRIDDSVSAFRKRLELFREMSLPMLKTLDNDSRLTIIDGDTDVPSVQQEFAAALYQLMRKSRRKEEDNLRDVTSPRDQGNPKESSKDSDKVNGGLRVKNALKANQVPNGISKKVLGNGINSVKNVNQRNKPVRQIANGVLNNAKNSKILQNGNPATVQNGVANGAAHYLQNGAVNFLQNGAAHLANGITVGNNRVAPVLPNNVRDPVRNMYHEIDGYQRNPNV